MSETQSTTPLTPADPRRENSVIRQLSPEDALSVLRNEIGYVRPVPSILEFLDDDYFLGSFYYDKFKRKSRVYGFWRDALQQVFPNDVVSPTYISVSGAIGCLTGDTKIRLLSGKSITIKELAESNNKCQWIYAFDLNKKHWVPALAADCFLSGKDTEVFRVTFDDGTFVEGTGNHPFLLTSGEYRNLEDLEPGDSVESLYLKQNPKDWKFYDKYEVAEEILCCGEGKHIHHKNFNRHDNCPENLEIFNSNAEHLLYHNKEYWSHENSHKDRAKLTSKRMRSGFSNYMHQKKMEKWKENPQLVKKATGHIVDFNRNRHPRLRKDITYERIVATAKSISDYRAAKIAAVLNCSKTKVATEIYKKHSTVKEFAEKNGINYNPYANHSVLKVEPVGRADVYDIVVPDYNNFGVEDQNGNLIFTHNTGKSTFSQIIFLYDMYKYYCINNPSLFLELINLNGIKFKFFNVFKYKALEMVEPLHDIIARAPCFQDIEKERKDKDIVNITIGPAVDTKDIISEDVPSFILSEVNFFEPQKAIDLINSCLSRLESRFQKGIDLLTHFILDSSDVSSNSPTELFVRNSAYSDRILSFRCPIWKAKPALYFHRGSFKVYAGDSAISPHIMEEDEDTSDLDQDRIIDVPEELRPNFESDVQLALQEKVGVGLIQGGMLFPDDKIKSNFKLQKFYADVGVIDFFDTEQIQEMPGISASIANLPKSRPLYVGLDAGVAEDKFGIAVGYADNIRYREMPDGTKVPEVYMKVPIAFSLSRKEGQETSITKVKNFILYLNSIFSVKKVIVDTFQSLQLKQEMELNRIDCEYMSVDRSDQQYLILKRVMYENRVDIARNGLLYKELKCLQHIDGKVDHTEFTAENLKFGDIGTGGVNSKDIADALCRVVNAMIEDGDEAFVHDPESGSNGQQLDAMLDIYKSIGRARDIKSRILRADINRRFR